MTNRHLAQGLLRAVFLLGALAGCASDPGTRQLLAAAVPFAPKAQPKANAAFLAAHAAHAPALAAAVESRPQAIAVLVRQAKSDHSGVETMIGADGAQLMFDQGLLVGSRGFGHDLLAAEVSANGALVRSLCSGVATRLMTFLDGNDTATTRAFQCRITPRGPQSVTIGPRRIDTRTVTEDCRGALARFYNHYWVVPETGEIIQSSQWMGPHSGKVSLRKLPGDRN